MNYRNFSISIGFLVWLMATLVFRLFGQYFFLTANRVVLVGLYLSLIPVLGTIATWVFNRYRLTKLEAVHSAALMVLPGMLLDTFCIQYFTWFFPNLPATDGATFGSWLMWAYAIVLIFGIMRKGNNS